MDMMTNRFNWCAILTDSNRFANSRKKFIYTKTDFFLFKYCTNFNFEMHICECRLRLHARYTTSVHRFFSCRSNELALRAKIIVAWCNFINHTFKMQNSIWIIASFFFFVRMHFFGISKLRLYRIFTTFLCMRKIGTCFDSQRLCFTFFRREKKTCEAIRIRFTVFFGWITNCMTFCYPQIHIYHKQVLPSHTVWN